MEIRTCSTREDYSHGIEVTRAYVEWLGIDLSFQDLETELVEFDTMYGPPGGSFLLGFLGNDVAGGVGLRDLGEGMCEMKRLYVYDVARGEGVALALCMELISCAREMGYRAMRLDTLDHMIAARCLYSRLGFREIPPYRFNPLPGAIYMELELAGPGPESN